MEKVKIAVLGLFHGMNHVRSIVNCVEAELVGICDLKDEYRKDAQKYGVNFYLDYHEMFEKESIDGVVIALPNNLHAPVTEECTKRGLSVLLEKPVASSLEDAERIIKAEKEYGIKLLIGHHRRFSKYIQRLRQAVQSGEIGKFVCANILWNAQKMKNTTMKYGGLKKMGVL